MSLKNILFVGHDFKFLTHVIDHFAGMEQYHVELHHHKDHVLHDFPRLVQECLKADIIFCEWGLGNLSWLSKNIFLDQVILARVHSQEFRTNFLNDTYWESVHKVVLVGQHMQFKFNALFHNHIERSKLIYNVLDIDQFNHGKNRNAKYNIGLLGILPKSKAPHLGLELLLALKSINRKYKLLIKGQNPEEVSWVWENDTERNYYLEFYENIRKFNLNDSVIFESHGNDVHEWFQNVGFILSSSEFESFHMTIPEGMASGAIPLIRNWEGADMLYPSRFIFKDIKQAVSIIKRYSDPEKKEKEIAFLKKFSRKHFGKDVVLKQYDELIKEAVALSDSRQTEPSLRSVLANIFTTQENSITALNAGISKLETQLLGLQLSNSEKDKAITTLLGKEQQMSQTISSLNIELRERNNKVDSIISIADEMKVQLAISRDREIKKDDELKELIRQQSLFQKEVLGLKAQINDLKSVNNEFIASLKVEKDKQIQEDISISAKLAKLTQNLNEARQRNIALENELQEMRMMISETEQLVQSLSQKVKEQLQYIRHLEKRFLNKLIGFVKKFVKG